jgi:hypothetical protein
MFMKLSAVDDMQGGWKSVRLAYGWNYVSRDPNAEDSNIDSSYQNHRSPFHSGYCSPMFCDKCNSVDDDMHQQLDLENPAEQDKEQGRDSTSIN